MHEVILTKQAADEMTSAHEWWATHRSREQADDWYNGFIERLLSLELNPEQCPFCPENEGYPIEIRQLNYGLGRKSTHRAVFTIRESRVIVLRIRHLAQQPLIPDES